MSKAAILSSKTARRGRRKVPDPDPEDQTGQEEAPPGQSEKKRPLEALIAKITGTAWTPIWKVAAKYVLFIAAIWFVFTYIFSLHQMSGQTMYPRIMDGDLLLSYRLDRSLVQDDVVLYEHNDLKYVGRVVAQAGDVVDVSDDGYLVVNGNIEDEEVFYATKAQAGGIDLPYTVPEDSYFLLCDYRTAAADSRTYGAISKADIIGKVFTVVRRRGI
jgi:signal peptidase I